MEPLNRLQCDGFTVVKDAIKPALVDALRRDVLRLLAELEVAPGPNLL